MYLFIVRCATGQWKRRSLPGERRKRKFYRQKWGTDWANSLAIRTFTKVLNNKLPFFLINRNIAVSLRKKTGWKIRMSVQTWESGIRYLNLSIPSSSWANETYTGVLISFFPWGIRRLYPGEVRKSKPKHELARMLNGRRRGVMGSGRPL